MKIQHLAIIFIIIILPISMVISYYVNAQIKTIQQQELYDSKLVTATYDSVRSFQLNTINNMYSSVSDSKIRDIEAGISSFFNSLGTELGATGYNREDLSSFIPAILYTMYDGYYIYGITYVQMVCATDADTNAAIALRSQLLLMGTPFEEFKDDDLLIAQNGYNAIDIADRYGKSAESASASFLKWADSLSDNAPIVVMSHVPLHANRHDNYGGLIWFEALSKVAEKHDIIFLWGHNHTIEEKAKDYTDREDTKLLDRFFYLLTPADMLTPGDHIDIQGDVQTGVVSKTINFTYANAGYIKLGYGTVITFSDSQSSGIYDQVTFHRYGIDSISTETEIGFTGKKNPYTYALTVVQKGKRAR